MNNGGKLLTWQRLVFLVICAVLLSSCSSVSHQDGPPHYFVDASSVPDAVPRKERMSKYGNYHRYVVLGKAYHTLPTSKGYEEVGVASWYGTKFHKHKTSSGELYNMLGMTAAHRTLPLPTYVQVTNLKNGKQIIVKVNDRGPFAPNRIIDLSYVAAIKLGMIGHGTAKVDVKAIDPKEFADNGYHFLPIRYALNNVNHPISLTSHHHPRQYAAVMKAPVEEASFTEGSYNSTPIYLQLGAFQSYSNAQRLQNRVTKIINSPVKIATLTHHNKPLYHVRIGPFKDLASANRLSHKLKTYGLSGKLA